MGLRDGPEPAELWIREVELDPLVARTLLAAVRRRRRGRLGLLDGSLSPGAEFNGAVVVESCIQFEKVGYNGPIDLL